MIRRAVNAALLLILLLAVVFSLTACWDRREVEKLGIVMATGVDLSPEGRVRVIVQNINPPALGKGMAGGTGGGGGAGTAGKAYRNRSVEANTVFDALRDLSRQTPRQLFFAHNQVILLSEKLARERGVQEVLDFFERNPQIRRTTWLLVARGDLLTLLDEPGRLEDTPAQRIFGIIENRRLTSQYAVEMLGNFLEMMDTESTCPYTALVERIPNPASPEEHAGSLAEGHIAEPHHVLRLNGTAVFHGDKMAGLLNSRESRGLLWIRGKVRGGTIDVLNPEQKGSHVSLEITKADSKLETNIKNGRAYVSVDIRAESNIGETTGYLNLIDEETIKKLEALLAGAIREEAEAALNKAQQEYGSDIFGFGQAVHRNHPGYWKKIKNQWLDIFPDVPVSIQVQAKIRRTGMVTNPVVPVVK